MDHRSDRDIDAVTIPRRARLLTLCFVAAAVLASSGVTTATNEPSPSTTPDPMAGIAVERDIVFSEASDPPLRLDIYRRDDAGDEKQPVLLFLHGGGWVSGGRRDAVPEDDPRMRGRSTGWSKAWPSMLPYIRRGVTLVTVDYRLAPKAPEPAAIEDAFHALAWVGHAGARHGLDPTRVALAGVSAGGHLALMVGLTAGSGTFFPTADLGNPPATVRGVIDLYGVTDVADLLVGDNARPFTAEWIPSGSVTRARRLSPLTYVHSDAPPVLIVHGDADAVVPYEQSQRLARALEAAGDRVEFVSLQGADHGWFEPGELAEIEAAVLGFLRSIGLLAPNGPAPSQD